MTNIEGLYFHLLEESEVERRLIPRFKPLMFGIAAYTKSIHGSFKGYIYLSLLKNGSGYMFHFGYAQDLSVLTNGKSITAKHHHNDLLEFIPRSESDAAESISFRGNTIMSADGNEEYFSFLITYLPDFSPSLIMDLSNVSKGLSQTIELRKISSSKYPFDPTIRSLKL